MGENQTEKSSEEEKITIAEFLGIILFHDQFHEAHVLVPDGKIGCIKVKSKEFALWAWGKLMGRIDKARLSHFIDTAVVSALYYEPEYPLDVRIAESNGRIFYDLGSGMAVEIRATGWEIVDAPIMFRRFKHQKMQVTPVQGGDVRELLRFVNLPAGASGITNDQLLFLVWTIAAFIPGWPHPLPTFHGSQGSGKTSAFEMLKDLIDPSQMRTLSFSEKMNEVVQQGSHHYFLPYDNLTELTRKQSDLLCRMCSGIGLSKRKLWTDDDDVVYSYQRIIGLNGINVVPTRADLLDRSLIIKFERFERPRSSKALWQEFNAVKPRLLGAIFDAVVKTLQVVDAVKEPEEFRMADFARYGCAIAKALGYPEGAFLAAYRENLDRLNHEALAATLIGPAIVRLMEAGNRWEGTATNLLEVLNEIALVLHIDTRLKEWPKDARWVWRRIQEISANLAYFGIVVGWHDKDSKTITITKK